MKKTLIILGSLLILSLTASVSTAKTLVEGIRLWAATTDTLRLVLDVEKPVSHQIFSLQNPDRLVIDLEDTTFNGVIPSVGSAEHFVREIRSGSPMGHNLRIVLDLKWPAKAEDFWLKPSNDAGHRLVLDLNAMRGYPSKSLYTPTDTKDKKKISPTMLAHASVKARQYDITPRINYWQRSGKNPVVKTSAWQASQSIPKSISIPRSVRGRDLIIVIDPGHGGKDPGAVGPHGTFEKDVVLAIAKRLARQINTEPGMRAVLTRSRDVFIPLRQRVRKARRASADLFVSIHADASGSNPNASGASVYTLSERGASSETARLLAAKENAADLVGGVAIDDKDDLLATVLLDMSLSATMEASRKVANNVLQHMYRIGDLHKENVQHAGFAVLKAPDIPGMLVETAYISNYEEEILLKRATYQQEIAHAIFTGVREYFLNCPPAGTRIAKFMQSRRISLADDNDKTSAPGGFLSFSDVIRKHR